MKRDNNLCSQRGTDKLKVPLYKPTQKPDCLQLFVYVNQRQPLILLVGQLSSKEGGDWPKSCSWAGGKSDKSYCFYSKRSLGTFRKRSLLLCAKIKKFVFLEPELELADLKARRLIEDWFTQFPQSSL